MTKTLTRTLTEIANDIYHENAGYISRRKINSIVNDCFSFIAQELINGKSIIITNFGKFKPTKHKLYPSASFTPSKKLKKEIRENIEYWKQMSEIYHQK